MTVPDRGIPIPEPEALKALVAALEDNADGLLGVLVEMEVECRRFLEGKGVVFRNHKASEPGYLAFLYQDLASADDDPYTREISALYLSVAGFLAELPTHARHQDVLLKEGFRLFKLGAAAEAVRLATVRKLALTGKKSKAAAMKGNKSEARQEDMAMRHEEILVEAKKMRRHGTEDRYIAGCIAEKRKQAEKYPSSRRRIRQILMKSGFY